MVYESEDESAIEPADDPPISPSVAMSHLLALEKFCSSEGMEAEAMWWSVSFRKL